MIKKIYLSRTQTRAMSIDHPIGDPTGGPAYGEKNDPISAAISIGTMFTVAEAGFAAMTVMQGITFAGAAVSLLGNITGNSSLMKLGAIAGIAGGIGAFAESQGLFSSGNLSETLGMKSSVTDEMLKGTTSVTPVTNGAPTGGPDVVQKATTTTSAIPKPDIPNVNTPSVNTAGVDGVVGGEGANIKVAGGNGTRSLNMNPAAPTAPGPFVESSTGLNVLKTELDAASKLAKPGFVDSLKAGNLGDAASAAGSGAMDMLKNNPTGAYVAAQAIGGVADWLSGKTDSEIAALKANTGFADAKAQEIQLAIAKEERRRLNMANRYTSVSPQANTTVSAAPNIQAPGLVAANMQTRPV